MKLITAYTVAAALLCQTASVSATECSTDNINAAGHTSVVVGTDMVGLQKTVVSYGGLYRVSGIDDSTFATSGNAKMTLQRSKPHWPAGSTHISASTVASGIQDIINCCTNAKHDNCSGNTNERGDQGDTVTINIADSDEFDYGPPIDE